MSDTPAPSVETQPLADTERRGDIQFAPKDAGLRHDVHDLGVIVGELLADQGGSALFSLVENARRAAIDRREGDAAASARLEALIRQLSTVEARDLVRAFSTYFQAVNSAEIVHRIRRRREYMKEGLHRQPGGVEDTIFQLRDAGVTLDEQRRALAGMLFEPVMIPHPTEPTRRTILRRQQDIVRRLLDLQNAALSPRERDADLASIRDDLTVTWQTEEHPPSARSVADELEHVLFFLTDVVYRVVPVVQESIGAALEAAYGPAAAAVEVPGVLRFASWIGGDMVGRSEITARTIRETLSRQRLLLLDLYVRECRKLADELSQSTSRVAVSTQLLDRIRVYSGHFPNVVGITPLRHREMPYRVFLRLISARLMSTATDGLYPYESPAEFAADVRVIADSLQANGGRHAGLFAIRRLLCRIEALGFHFMTLDIRQEAIVNRRVIGRLLREDGWLAKSASERCERIRHALQVNESPLVEIDNEAKRAIGVFQAISFCRRRFGNRSIGPYVISQAEDVDDVLSVLLLAQWGELRQRGGVPLDIAPSLETIPTLANGAEFFTRLHAEPLYREHLAARGNRQTILLGVADTAVDVDLASGRAAQREAEHELTAAADAAGIELTMFLGRGGAVSAGGGKAHAAVLGVPGGSVRGRIRATEPGELAATKYAVRAIAVRTLEQTLAAILASTLRPTEPPDEKVDPRWRECLATLAATSLEWYQALVVRSPGFSDYYRLATPADVIERMRRGSGPESPVSEGLLAAAGAAPWVFAWTQSRNMLPVWYGFGAGLTRALDQFGEAMLRDMLAGWYFFRTLVADVEIALAKSDLRIARRYSQLGGELHERFFPPITQEFERSVAAVLRLRQHKILLEKENTLRRGIRLRNPYVDPMSLLQVELLKRWRSSGDDAELAALIATVNGIARGLQDAG